MFYFLGLNITPNKTDNKNTNDIPPAVLLKTLVNIPSIPSSLYPKNAASDKE